MFKPVIKWSGSKRSQAEIILSHFPQSFGKFYDPFVGGGSITYAVSPKNGVCGDICRPLIDLWNEIKNAPDKLAASYKKRWQRLQDEGYQAYYDIRDDFNSSFSAEDLLFLSRTCVNGLIRFNAQGQFNNSLHHTRAGIAPDSLERIIKSWSERLAGVEFHAQDYRETTADAKKGDLIYLDPPYFHTTGRYYGKINYNEFLSYLEELNRRGVKYVLSYDGKRGDSDYTVDLPKELYKRHEFVPSGNASFKKVMDGEAVQVFESLYLNW